MPKAAVIHLKIANHFPDPHFRLATMRVPQHGATHEQHTHDFEELVVILDGHGKHEVGREVYDISAGDVFVLLGDVSHCYPEAKNLSLINILYDPANLRLPRADLGALPGYHALFEVEPRLRQRQRFQNRLQLGMDELGRTSCQRSRLAVCRYRTFYADRGLSGARLLEDRCQETTPGNTNQRTARPHGTAFCRAIDDSGSCKDCSPFANLAFPHLPTNHGPFANRLPNSPPYRQGRPTPPPRAIAHQGGE